jgi:hypothetical protein
VVELQKLYVFKVCSLIFILLVLISGCNGKNLANNETNPLTISSTLKDISFNLTVDKLEYTPGEEINLVAEIKNNSKEAFVHHGSGNCDDSIYFFITGVNETEFFVGEGSIHPQVCTGDYREFRLESGASLKESATFFTRIENVLNGKEKMAEIGDYNLVAKYGNIRVSFPISIK